MPTALLPVMPQRQPRSLLFCLISSVFVALGCGLAAAQDQQAKPPPAAAEAAGKPAPAATIKADPAIVEKYSSQVASFKRSLDELASETNHVMVSDTRLKEIPAQLEEQRKKIRDFVETLRPLQRNIQERVGKLGPAPKDGAAPEAENLAMGRAAINARLAAYDSLIKNAELLSVRAGQIIERANNFRRYRFSEQILSPADNFYTTSLWRNAFTAIGIQSWLAAKSLISVLAGILSDKPGHAVLALLLPLIVGVSLTRLVGTGAEQHWLGLTAPQPDTKLDWPEIGMRATLEIVRRAVPVLLAMLIAYLLVLRFELLPDYGMDLFASTMGAIGFAWVLFVSSRQIFSPAIPAVLFFTIDSVATRKVQLVLYAILAIWLADHVVADVDQLLAAPLALIVLRSLITAATIALLIFLLLRIRLRPDSFGVRSHFKGWPRTIALSLAAIASVIALACLLGYVSLGRFVAIQVVVTGGIVMLMYLAHLSAEHISSLSLVADPIGNVSDDAGQDSVVSPGGTLQLMASLAFDIVILVVGIPAILLQWGFDWAEVKGWLSAAFFGFQIGDYTISIQNVLIALGILAGGIVITRGVQRWFMKRSDTGLRTDTGIRDSIAAGLGYGGVTLSLLAAVSYLGINFSNLAIIAGALSVGMGFGLQTIVNNFVSGLILLVERPIKVGDWISVGEADGLVRKISVRATELETLDKQSIIVPNSEFIGKPVTNWMYNERIGRISVAVGVSYSSDVDIVERLLLEVAKSNKYVLRYPAPSVIFNDFGDSSLDFLLRVYINDMENKVPAGSSIRFSIWRALKDAGIEIPFPQRDIHVKDVQEVVHFSKQPVVGTAS